MTWPLTTRPVTNDHVFYTDISFISVSFPNSATGTQSLNKGIDHKGIKTFTFYEINVICVNDMDTDHVTSDQSSTESSTRWSAESSGSEKQNFCCFLPCSREKQKFLLSGNKQTDKQTSASLFNQYFQITTMAEVT